MNDDERRMWVENDEGLYYMWKQSRLPISEFIKQNRAILTEHINRAINGGAGGLQCSVNGHCHGWCS
jgi:hypothetical protein